MQRFLILIYLILLTTPVSAQTSADLFNAELLQEIRLDVHPKDWLQLKATYLENTYYPVDMHWLYNGKLVTVEQAGIRSRGTGSRHPVKPGLRVDFNRYDPMQKFLGLRSLTLRNNVQDASMLHERISFALMQRLGIPAPRVAHVRLYVNDQYMGLYSAVENIDEDFLRDRFDDEGGYLYEYDYGRTDLPYFFEYRGSDPALYSPKPFQPETHESNPQADRIVSMVRAINQSSDLEFETTIAEYVDLKNFVTELAVEAYLSEQDGIIGDFGLNNFYLYRAADSNRFLFLPWDKSQTFFSVDRSAWTNIETNVLTRRAFAIPAIREIFKNALLNASFMAGATNGWLEQEILRAYNQIADAARQDLNKHCYDQAAALRPCSNEQFEAAVAEMIGFARGRKSRIDRDLNGATLASLTTLGFQAFSIADGGAVVYTTSNSSSSVKTGHGYLEPATGSAGTSGLAIFDFKRNGVLITETAIPASVPLRAGRISAHVKGLVTTGVAIANPHSKPVTITFFFTDSDGHDYGHGSAVIVSGGQIAGFLNEPPFSGGTDIQGTFSFNATLPVGVLALRGFTNERADFLITATPVGNLFNGASEPSTVPHFAHGAGWSTEVTLVNLEDAPTHGVVEFRTNGSTATYPYSIPPRASVRVSPDAITSATSTGAIRVLGDGRPPVVGTLLSFKAAAVTVSQTITPAVRPTAAFRMYVEASGGVASSVALANPAAVPATVRLEMSTLSGEPMGFSGTLTIPGGGQTAVYLNEIPGFEAIPAKFQGVLRISSLATAVSGVGFRNRTNERGDYVVTTVPPVVESATTSSVLSFPHLVDSGGYETHLVLIGADPGRGVAGAFRYRNGVGDLVDLGLK